ncbi:TetR/AcrR family transcriptional regulator [Pontibacillus salicampi]|uniref:TetR/AcrR family transcriptional regulator n=1 Tax=Pontibacillus salicampi TaxID=1449801 RepID=A0ABV6LS83_9BACI
MNEKKRTLIETGMKLFAQKGFHETSIQEIADNGGVSKGAFYLHFNNKEDLLIHIHQYYYYGLMEEVNRVRKLDLEPKESLAEQIKVLLQTFMNNKEFIIMHMRENVNVHSESSEFLLDIRRHSFRWARSNLLTIYGSSLQRKVIDASILLEGFLHGYVKWLVIDDLLLDLDSLSKFIVRRVDDAILGMMEEAEEAQITPEKIQEHFPQGARKDMEEAVQDILGRMRGKIEYLDIQESQKTDLYSTISVMEQEMENDEPQRVIFQGMLSLFKAYSPFHKDIEEILEFLDIK